MKSNNGKINVKEMNENIDNEVLINVKKLCYDNQLKIHNYSYIKEWRNIKQPTINRVGLELMGFLDYEDIDKSVIGFGHKESKIMDLLDEQKMLEQSIENAFKHKPPLIICSSNVSEKNVKLIVKYSNKYGIPVSIVNHHLQFIVATIAVYIAEHFAPQKFVHGSLVIVNGIGILITGESGIGKSEAVIELIQRGHILVSDDSVMIKRIGNRFVGFRTEITKNIVESRGLGLIDIRTLYGEKAVKDRTNIDLVIELKKDEGFRFDRIGNKNYFFNVLDGKIKKVLIPMKIGRNVASLIEAATSIFIARKEGVNTVNEIKERIKKSGI